MGMANMKFKKILLCALALVLLAALSGCVVIPLAEYYDIPETDVDSVQFYDLRKEETVESRNFHIRYEPAYDLPYRDLEAFLYDFSKLKFSRTLVIVPASVDPSFSYGKLVVRINFVDGSYRLYSSAGYGQTFSEKNICTSTNHYSCDEEDLEALINKYYITGVAMREASR